MALRKSYLLCALAFALLSCSKEAEEPLFEELNATAQQPTRSGEMIKFADSENFGKFMQASIKKKTKEVEALSAKLGVRSLSRKMQDKAAYSAINPATATQSTSTSRTDVEDDELVPDPYFAAVLNDKREVAIGEHIFRITSDGTFMYEPGKSAALDNLLQDRARVAMLRQKPAQNGLIEAEAGISMMSLPPIELTPEPIDPEPGDGGGWGGSGGGLIVVTGGPCDDKGGNVFGTNYTCTVTYADGDRRIKGRLWSLNYGIYATIGANTRCQNKFAEIWWAQDANYVKVDWEGEYQYKDVTGVYYSVFEPFDYRFLDNTNEVEKVFDVNTAVFKVTNTGGTGGSTNTTVIKTAYAFKIKWFTTNHVLIDSGTKAIVKITAR